MRTQRRSTSYMIVDKNEANYEGTHFRRKDMIAEHCEASVGRAYETAELDEKKVLLAVEWKRRRAMGDRCVIVELMWWSL